MVRARKQLVAKLTNEQGEVVWVSKAGGSYWIRHGEHEKLCHPSIRSIVDTQREALTVFHVNVPKLERLD